MASRAKSLLGLGQRDVGRAQRLGWEHRKEADERVEVNLDPWEIPLWRRIKGRFKGTPHSRFEQFRHYVHDHPGALSMSIVRGGEERTKKEIKSYESQPFVPVPCAPPHRFRNRGICKGTAKKKTGRGGRDVDVPCKEPFRYRTKDLCDPRPVKAKPYEPAEEPHAFEGLL